MTEQEKTVVRPNTENYVKTKTAGGNTSLHNGDVVASTLAALLLDETYAVASKLLGVDVDTLKEKYGKLNLGMQRMNLGNRIRGAIAKLDKGNAKEIDKIEAANVKAEKKAQADFEKAVKAHEAAVAKLEEGQEAPISPVLAEITLQEVPELVEGAGEQAFIDAVEEFKPAIDQRAEEAAAAQAEKEAEAKRKAEEKAAKDAEKKAKADAAKAAKEAEAE